MNPDNPTFRTPEEEARAEELIRLKAENARLLDRIEKQDRMLKRTESAALHALLEMSAWMGIPEHKRAKRVASLMSNVTFCATTENEFMRQQELDAEVAALEGEK